MPERRSWGWYPVENPNPFEALVGAQRGILNKGGAIDPHHGTFGTTPGIERLEVFATKDFASREALITEIDAFANAYEGRWGLVGCSCRSFQNRLFSRVGLRAVLVAP